MGKSQTFVLAVAAIAVSSGLAIADRRERKPSTYALDGAVIKLPESGLSRHLVDSKSVSYGPNVGQVLHVETASWEHEDILYTLTVATLPDSLKRAPVERLLAGARKGLLEPAGQGTELDLEQRKQVPVPGGTADCIALNIRAGKNRVRARIVAHEGRIVQLTAVGSRSDMEASAVTAALDSFELVAHSP